MIVRYLDPVERLEYEIIQRSEEGSDVSEFKEDLTVIKQLRESGAHEEAEHKSMHILQELRKTPSSPKLLTDEPDDLEQILALRPKNRIELNSDSALSDAEYRNKILGGWLGRAAGCLLGKPVEKYHRSVIREMLESNGNWPLSNYFTQKGMPNSILQKYPWKRRRGVESLRENIRYMPEDDDLNYTMLNLYVLENYSAQFTSLDIGTEWLKKIPVYETFTAERITYYNLLSGYEPPETASYLNPFREWIGAQIRADLWGYVVPGNPQQAAEYAWRDARLSHVRNGIYGEMFCAAMIAGAFVESNPRNVVTTGLGEIPESSRLANAIRFVLDLPMENMDWETVVDQLYKEFGEYHWVHTINNAALVAAAVLYSDGDLEQTICNTVMGGWDTDSCGATAGSVIGVIQGAAALPGKWIDPLNNLIQSSMGGFDNTKFSELADRTLGVTKNMTATQIQDNVKTADDF